MGTVTGEAHSHRQCKQTGYRRYTAAKARSTQLAANKGNEMEEVNKWTGKINASDKPGSAIQMTAKARCDQG